MHSLDPKLEGQKWVFKKVEQKRRKEKEQKGRRQHRNPPKFAPIYHTQTRYSYCFSCLVFVNYMQVGLVYYSVLPYSTLMFNRPTAFYIGIPYTCCAPSTFCVGRRPCITLPQAYTHGVVSGSYPVEDRAVVVLRKYCGQRVATFLQAAGNLRQRRLWALKILILPPKFRQNGGFQPQFLCFFFTENFPKRDAITKACKVMILFGFYTLKCVGWFFTSKCTNYFCRDT